MARRIAFACLSAALAVHFACALGVIAVPPSVTGTLSAAIALGAVALVAARALSVRRNRDAWALIAGGLVFGDVAFQLGHGTVAGASYLGMFAFVYVALASLLRDRIRPFPAWLTIDGLLAGLTLAALASTMF